MALVQIANKILRSLCANTPTEEDMAVENYGRLTIGHLQLEGNQRKLVDEITSFYTHMGGPPTTGTLRDRFARQNEISVSLLADEVGTEDPTWGANFMELLIQYREELGQEKLSTLLTEAAQIAGDGMQVAHQPAKKGLEEALAHVIRGSVEIQQTADPHQKSMANDDAVEFLRDEYLKRMDQPTLAFGMTTGLTPLDEATKGGQPGELWIVGGFVSHGKTTFALNWMRYLAVYGGFNVMIYSLEMKKEQVWRILACSHSSHPKWEGRTPLEYDKIKGGVLSREDYSWYINEVLPDLKSSDYGRIEVVQPSGETTISDIRARAEVVNRQFPLDVLVVDYLQLVGADPKKKMGDSRQATNHNIAAAKQMALEFDHGNSILVVSPHQINRKGEAKARENGGVYEMEALADNNEAERSADVVVTVYQDGPLRQKDEAVICHLKSRDSHRVDPFNIYAPSRHRLMGDLVTTETGANLEQLLDG